MRCRICNAYVPEGATHCIECGTSTDPVVTCQNCGTEAPESARFCRICGTPMTSPPEIPARTDEPISKGSDGSPCPRCGVKVAVGVVHCPVCGTNQSLPDQTLPKTEPEGVPDDSQTSEATGVAEESKPCPRCGTLPRGEGRFCYNCGRFLDSDIVEAICPSCGSTNTLRYSRCQYCGSDMPKTT